MTDAITPRMKVGGKWYRLHLFVSKEDHAKVRRGRGWTAEVTEVCGVGVGRKWKLRAATCGIPTCYCDAIAKEVAP